MAKTKKNKKLSTLLVVTLLALVAVGGMLAYLQSEDSDINVMTTGNVKINQLEYQRAEGVNHNVTAETGDLVPFDNGQAIYPAVPKNNASTDYSAEMNDLFKWGPYVTAEGAGNGLWNDQKLSNVMDKMVFVENTGKSDAYYRTIIAFECPEGMEYSQGADKEFMMNINAHNLFTWSTHKYITIGNTRYLVKVATYNEALKPGEISRPSLLQVVMTHNATNEDMELLGDTYDILVVSQAVQTEGFDSADQALNAAFGEITETNHPWAKESYDTWDGSADTSWYNETNNNFVLNTAEEVAGLAKLVNEGNTFSKKIISLGSDIVLANKEWTPIGNSENKFQGTFDGQNHTIEDLNITGNKSNVGFFGFTTNGMVKNLKFNDAKVSGYLNVGAVAGTPYTSKYENITVTGLVQVNGFSYVGGVGGKNAYASWDNITVDVEKGSYVKAHSINNAGAYRTYVGGVVGFMGEGGHSFSNVTSNIDVTGSTCDVGGIVGIAHYGNSFINCKSSGKVEITDANEAGDAEEIGGIAGVWNNGGADVTFDGCEFTGTLKANITEGVDLSDNTIVGKPYSASGSGNLIIK